MDLKALIQKMDTINEDVKHKSTKNYTGDIHDPEEKRDEYGHRLPNPNKTAKLKRGGQTKATKDDEGNDVKHDTSSIQAMLGNKPTGTSKFKKTKITKMSDADKRDAEMEKQSAGKASLKDWMEVVETNTLLNEMQPLNAQQLASAMVANDPSQMNSSQKTQGDEAFQKMMKTVVDAGKGGQLNNLLKSAASTPVKPQTGAQTTPTPGQQPQPNNQQKNAVNQITNTMKQLPNQPVQVHENNGGELENIISANQQAVENFKHGGELDYDLESDLWEYYFNKGEIKNYNADASEFIAQRFAEELGLDEGSEKWIKGAIKHPGAFSAKAKRAGETTAQYAREKSHAPGTLGKQARLAQTLSKMHEEVAPKNGEGAGQRKLVTRKDTNPFNESKKGKKPEWLEKAEVEAEKKEGKKVSDKEKKKVGVEESSKETQTQDKKADIVKKGVKNNPFKKKEVEEGAKVDRMVGHVKASEKKAGKSNKDAENIAWATANKRGMLDNKNKKKQTKESKVVALKALVESINFQELMSHADEDIQTMLMKLQADVETFKKTGESSDLLDAFLKVHLHHEKKQNDMMNQEPLVGDEMTDEGQFTQHYMDANKPSKVRQQAEIAKVPKQHTPWSVDPIQATTDRAGSFIRGLASKPKSHPFEGKTMKDIQLESWNKQLNILLAEGITVSTSQGQEGSPDSVTINATDMDAQELMSILRNSGMGHFGGGDQQGTDLAQQQNPNKVNMMSPPEGNGTQPEQPPEVAGDDNDILALIKKLSGAGANPEGAAEVEISSEPEAAQGEQDYEPEDTHAEQDSDEGDLENEYGSDHDEESTQDKFNKGKDDEETVDDEEPEETDEGNAFGQAAQNTPKGEHIKIHGKDTGEIKNEEHDHDDDEICNECGMMECECPSEQGVAEGDEMSESYANSDDDTATQDIDFITKWISGGLNGPKKSQATGNVQKVTMETKLMNDSASLLTQFQKLSGIK